MDDLVEAREPWFRRYAQRGPGEAGLQLASLEARGLHSDLQRLMHSQGQPYGHLSFVRGAPLTSQELASLLHCPAKAVAAGLEELVRLQVWKKGADGVLFDPQLIAMWDASAAGRYWGRQGGNPTLKKSKKQRGTHKPPVNAPHNPLLNPPDNPPVNGVNPPLNPDQIRSDQKRERRSDARAPGSVPDPESGSEPAPPSVEEVVTFGQGPAGIPEAYCRKFHSYVSGVKKWLTKTAHGIDLVDWRRQLNDRWVEDRAMWQAGKKTAATENAETLRQQIEASSDETEKAALRRRLANLDE